MKISTSRMVLTGPVAVLLGTAPPLSADTILVTTFNSTPPTYDPSPLDARTVGTSALEVV
jgi:hypothetical protein